MEIREKRRACHSCEFYDALKEGDRESFEGGCRPEACDLNAYLGLKHRHIWDEFTELREWTRDDVLVSVVRDRVRKMRPDVLRAWVEFNRVLNEAAEADAGR